MSNWIVASGQIQVRRNKFQNLPSEESLENALETLTTTTILDVEQRNRVNTIRKE